MKVLKGLKLRYLVYLSLFLTSSLFASDGRKFLTGEKQQILEIEEEVNKKSSTSLRYDWIKPIVASYSYSKSDQIGEFSSSKYFRISVDQPFFKSGGIYFAIKYSNANETFKEIAFKMREANLIKSLYDGVLNLKKLDFQIQKANLSLKNAHIDIKRKKELFESGLLDSSFLDSAILNKTKLQHSILNLESLKFKTENSFKNISDINYKDIKLPEFKSIQKDEFIKNSLEIASKKMQKNEQRNLKNMTISSYLPTFSLFGDYNRKDDEIQFFKQAKEYKSYGARVSMPIFAINRGRDIEIRKLEYLKAKISLNEQKKISLNEFLSIENSILILKKRVEIAKNDLILYDSLIKNTDEGLSAGEKTLEDLQTLKNSKNIAKLDAKIYEIDTKLEILKLYAKMKNEI